MASNPKRNVLSGEASIERIYDTASMLGLDVIELCWSDHTSAIQDVCGGKVPVIDSIGVGSVSEELENSSARWIEGKTMFYPDRANRAWGYVYDIPENRLMLAECLGVSWWIIVDKRVRDEVIELAKERGLATEAIPKPQMNIKISKREREATEHAKNLASRLEDYEDKLAQLRAELALAKEQRNSYMESRNMTPPKEPEKEKPLKGVRLSKKVRIAANAD